MIQTTALTSRLSAVLTLVLCAAPAGAQDVAYEKYQLDNGMTVILHEDHALPQVNVNIWYRVGAKDELAGRSGFAHLFEHLMFMGTERVPGAQFDLIMEAGGGFNNATTSLDRTNYFDNGPSELLSSLLWLEADRLEALGANMTQDKLDKQREVVRNERRQNYENRPYGSAYLESAKLLFPAGHPYHIPVIGTHADLEAATVEDVQRFFATYYVPNNASLVVAGDFDPEVVKPLIQKLFGSLARGREVEHVHADPGRLERDVHAELSDEVQFAQTTLYWHSPPFFAPGDAEMDLIGAILSDGISSRLYQALVVEQELAVEVDAFQESRMLGSTFAISALAKPEASLADVERVIDEVLKSFIESGPTAAELERRQAKMEASTLLSLQSIQSKADRLNLYELHFGEPNAFARDLDRYRGATREGLQKYAREVLGDAHRATLHVLPATDASLASNPRDERPAPLAEGAFNLPQPEGFELPGGVPVQFWRREELPLVEVGVLLPVGSASDPADKGGLAYLTAAMLDEGAGERGAVAFADDLERLGASLAISVDQEWTELRLTALRRNFDASLALLGDALLRPTFDEKEWQRVHELHVSGLRQDRDSPTTVARNVAMRAFFGDAHAYGRPIGGTPDSASGIKQGDALGFFVDRYGPKGAKLLVAGDLTRDEAEAVLGSVFGEWKGLLEPRGEAEGTAFAAAQRTGFRALIVDRPGAVQTVIRFMLPAPEFTSPARPAHQLVATVLGGTFTSRLNQNLREDKGYTYGARSSHVFGPSASYLVASSSVRADVTGASLREFLAEFARLRTGDVAGEEAGKARASFRLRTIQRFAGLSGILDAGGERLQHGLAFNSLATDLEAVARLGQDDLNALTSEAVPLEHGVLVLVGDEEKIRTQIDGLGLPELERVDVGGEPLAQPGD
ncbi:MAG: insulinase family protein [bacterium]|nr:insulinase family protein [bacterium]